MKALVRYSSKFRGSSFSHHFEVWTGEPRQWSQGDIYYVVVLLLVNAFFFTPWWEREPHSWFRNRGSIQFRTVLIVEVKNSQHWEAGIPSLERQIKRQTDAAFSRTAVSQVYCSGLVPGRHYVKMQVNERFRTVKPVFDWLQTVHFLTVTLPVLASGSRGRSRTVASYRIQKTFYIQKANTKYDYIRPKAPLVPYTRNQLGLLAYN